MLNLPSAREDGCPVITRLGKLARNSAAEPENRAPVSAEQDRGLSPEDVVCDRGCVPPPWQQGVHGSYIKQALDGLGVFLSKSVSIHCSCNVMVSSISELRVSYKQPLLSGYLNKNGIDALARCSVGRAST